jgi:chitin disaccharide deacetylase
MSLETQTNELLGYPPDARLLILNGDDFGVCHAENEGTMQLVTQGLGSSCTLMMPCPWSYHGVDFLKAHPEIDFGVHLTIVGEYPYYRWRPLSPKASVRSLVDDAGYFMNPVEKDRLMQRFKVDEVETEFQAQIQEVLSQGLKPTHLDSHWHYHELRDDIFDVALKLAREYGLAIRAGHRDVNVEKVREAGLPVPQAVIDSGRLLDPTGVMRDSSYSDPYRKMLHELPPGLTEWAIHVGTDTPELRTLMPLPSPFMMGTWRGRKADLDFFMSQEARDLIKAEGIIVLGYAPLQQVWQARRIA